MLSIRQLIQDIRQLIIKEGKYDINMLIDDKNGITLKVWMTFFNASLGYLLHL